MLCGIETMKLSMGFACRDCATFKVKIVVRIVSVHLLNETLMTPPQQPSPFEGYAGFG